MVNTEFDGNIKCRACFSEEQEMHHLYGEFDQGMSLSEILESISPFLIRENDGLSPYLCEVCTTVVVDFFNFSAFYRENEKYIKCLLKQECKNIEHINPAPNSDNDHTEENKGDISNEKSDEIIENYDDGSVKESNVELEITGGFIDPQDIIKQEILTEDKIEYEEYAYIEGTQYAYEESGKLFLLRSDLQQRTQNNHGKSITLDDSTFKDIENDIKSKHDKLHCNICKKRFTTSSEIREHYKVHKKYICEHCGAGFLKKSYFEDHCEIHTTERRHICPICGKAFRRRTVLVKHKKIHTHPRQCICEICGLRFNDKGTLKTHIKLRHIKERNFQCTICGQRFPLKSTLLKHILRHNDNRERPFTCSICFIAYKDKSSLNRHIIVKHTSNAKKPSCKFCTKQYTTNTNLLKHIRRHHSSKQNLNTDIKI